MGPGAVGEYDATLVVEARAEDRDWVLRTTESLSRACRRRWEAIVVCPPGDGSAFGEATGVRVVHRLEGGGLAEDLARLARSERIAYLTAGTELREPELGRFPTDAEALAVWVCDELPPAGIAHMQPHDRPASAWVASRALLRRAGAADPPGRWSPMRLFHQARENGSRPVWVSLAPAARSREPSTLDSRTEEPRTRPAKVTAFVPHRNGHRWLEQCLESICRQSRRADRIVVADDASDVSPAAIVARFDGVTLLRCAENVGPYRLLQEVVTRTPDTDAYLMQDADDWSAADRLELLLEAAQESGAEIVGCQELRVAEDDSVLLPVSYPIDANAALSEQPGGYPVLHPSSLVRRDLVARLGGYATGLRFGGDSEFLRRAAHAARVSNVPWHSYFRRDRPESLTRSPATGFGSPAREEVRRGLQARAKMNAALASRRMKPDLMPWKIAPPPVLEHVLGPPLPA